MKFTKMHGAGNDYVYVDCFTETIPENLPELARAISHRHFGVGGDGLILIRPSDVADARMQMFNVDGSESEMCGNALRCVAKYIYDHGHARRPSLAIETGNGVLQSSLIIGSDERVAKVTVDMGPPKLNAQDVPTTLVTSGRVINHSLDIGGYRLVCTCVSMGNPHCVVFVETATDDLVHRIGSLIENDPRFPRRTNVEFVEVLSPTEVRQRTWERGCGETWACGTGASAVCVAGVLTQRTERQILNHLLGGDLTLHWNAATDHVLMTGGATEVFSGEFVFISESHV